MLRLSVKKKNDRRIDQRDFLVLMEEANSKSKYLVNDFFK